MPSVNVPTALKVLRGTDQPCRINDMEPEPSLDVVKPDDLSPAASEKWDEIVKILQDCKVMTTADQDTLAAYCTSWCLLQEAYRECLNNSIIHDDKGVPQMNPIHRMQQQYFKQTLDAAKELGLTPAARTKVKTTEKKKSGSGFGGL